MKYSSLNYSKIKLVVSITVQVGNHFPIFQLVLSAIKIIIMTTTIFLAVIKVFCHKSMLKYHQIILRLNKNQGYSANLQSVTLNKLRIKLNPKILVKFWSSAVKNYSNIKTSQIQKKRNNPSLILIHLMIKINFYSKTIFLVAITTYPNFLIKICSSKM